VTTPADTTVQAQAATVRGALGLSLSVLRSREPLSVQVEAVLVDAMSALDALVAELDRLTALLDEAQTNAEFFSDKMAEARAELDRVTRDLAETERVYKEQLVGVVVERAQMRAELERLRADLGEAEARADRLEAVLYPPALNRERTCPDEGRTGCGGRAGTTPPRRAHACGAGPDRCAARSATTTPATAAACRRIRAATSSTSACAGHAESTAEAGSRGVTGSHEHTRTAVYGRLPLRRPADALRHPHPVRLRVRATIRAVPT
jgi:hypothetical protein